MIEWRTYGGNPSGRTATPATLPDPSDIFLATKAVAVDRFVHLGRKIKRPSSSWPYCGGRNQQQGGLVWKYLGLMRPKIIMRAEDDDDDDQVDTIIGPTAHGECFYFSVAPSFLIKRKARYTLET